MNRKIIVIVGPTAVGKTKLGVELAKRFSSEVINGDAFQIYRGMDIGTAKVTIEEAEGIPHHLIDICDPNEDYSAADYQRDARLVIQEMANEDKLPIVVGGTGLYIKAALFNYQFSSSGSNPDYRRQLVAFVKEHGEQELYERLKKVDPVAAQRIHPNNLVRVMRALEVYHETGQPFSAHAQHETEQSLYPFLCVGLTMERSRLYSRINQRVDQMISDGLLDEAESLYRLGYQKTQAMQAIGYKEFIPYFNGSVSLEEAVDQLKKNSRHYAKRQLTWFRRQMPVHWFDMTEAIEDFPSKADEIYHFVEKSFITK
ncbi:tRNA (adenosine(37)-N6)-dimethylallyltransferase MiaA [Sporolactobacillus kofuensis]|uniref:tRNA dimethylallyltransferase n=1 Tax=Sporolactobacillus kofuensis TaxID=269672 RepID=A0ABW1WAJ4_9BACL|nr:tRNA (adenosine(37)-N6)-dimethylallyltransferase MiaA [Sporolactobacillus kofuensis]MCO7174786.1 tRNA (adenosine(37)-N6)-dimethylallyltransferase MiaA [Sporolactobacillus kofuensis]